MANRPFDQLPGDQAQARPVSCGARASWGVHRLPLLAHLRHALLLPLLGLSATGPLEAQPLERGERRIVISLEERRLWLVEGADTLLAAPVAIGRTGTFQYGDRVFEWSTPRGEREVLAKRVNPVWTVPDWHYYERAHTERLELVQIVAGKRYPLADGSHLEVRGQDVVRVLDDQYWRVPPGRELIIDGVLYAPPPGTAQRRVPGALGTRALDLGEGYLIHGTHRYNRLTVGWAASHGCIRMETADIERLFELVDRGTRVQIY
jgi:lipoprotein-anchoring transpeptidase ErfK/SrfK